MKRLSIILLTLLAFKGYSQSPIVGDWKIDVEASIALMSADKFAAYDSLNADSKRDIKNTFEFQTYSFSADSTFIVTFDGVESSGTWTIDGNTLTMTFDSGGTTVNSIKVLTSSELVLDISARVSSGAMFQELSFKPANQ